MSAKSTSRRGGVLLPLSAAAAAMIGGVVSYSMSIASAAPVTPEIATDIRPAGEPADCWRPPNMDGYRPHSQTQLMPKLLSFSSGGALPAGDPCDDDDGGGGDGGGTSCLSTFGFDPTDYWAVLGATDLGAASATVYAAPINTFTALSTSDIPTATGCTVTYQWIFSQVDLPFSGIIGYWNSNGGSTSQTGATSTSMTVSGLVFAQQWEVQSLYGSLCDSNLALRVSDGVNNYDIKGPPCSGYRMETWTYTTGAGFKFEYQDPWSRPLSYDQSPDYLGQDGFQRNFAVFTTVKPNSPMTITFHKTGSYTLRTGLDWTVNCADASVNTTIFSGAAKTATSTWVDPSPATDRIYCLDEDLIP